MPKRKLRELVLASAMHYVMLEGNFSFVFEDIPCGISKTW
jgi:hypothetical protein